MAERARRGARARPVTGLRPLELDAEPPVEWGEAPEVRQDAVEALLTAQPLDLALVIGGYNSSNTCSLARICAERVPTFHIAEPACLVSAVEIRHRVIGGPSTVVVPEQTSRNWLPEGPVRIGLTAGASTPNSIVGEVIERLETLAGPGRP